MVNRSNRRTINLAASAARVRHAHKVAALQAQIVDQAEGQADALNIDLLYLTLETALLLQNTHRLLETLSVQEDRRLVRLATP